MMLYLSIVMLYIIILLIIDSFKKLVSREGYSDSCVWKEKILLNTTNCLESF